MDLDRLEELYVMKDKGLLSEEEFQRRKDELMNPDLAHVERTIPDSSMKGYLKGSFYAFLSALTRWKDVHGRTSRFDYWGFAFFYILLTLVYGIPEAIVETTGVLKDVGPLPRLLYSVISLIVSLFFFWVDLALLIRRFHDTGRSGWRILFVFPAIFVPFLKGEQTENRFGPAFETDEKKALRLILIINIPVSFLLILLGIVFAIGVDSGYSHAMERYRITKTVYQVQQISNGISELSSVRQNYTEAEKTKILHTFGIIDDTLCADKDCTTMTNLFGGKVGVKALEQGGFSLYYDKIPRRACVMLASFDWKPALKNFDSLTVNPEQGLSQNNTFRETVPPPVAADACSEKQNSIVWVMKDGVSRSD